eukprot:NODE_534_length_1495_cov_283.588889.p1 GENE.NODE_534_length_1495_cov_283.588889~~NODE_534_length_1495_cov_283.588889.p1  ORF type:complete len:374 (-),score=95.73 NODE_534_length_1495_cov_283.588889:221-1342(-)
MSGVPPADAWFLKTEKGCWRFKDFFALEELLLLRDTSKKHMEVCRPDVIAAIPAHPSWGRHRRRRYFIRALSGIANQGDSAAITALIKCLDDTAWEVRTATVWALEKLAEKGNKEVTSALLKCIRDGTADIRCEVRIAAVVVLAAIIEKPNSEIVTATRACLSDVHHNVRVAAAKSLPELVDKGDVPSIQTLARCLEDEKPAVREAAQDAKGAIDIPGKVSFPGDDVTIGAVAAAQKAHMQISVEEDYSRQRLGILNIKICFYGVPDDEIIRRAESSETGLQQDGVAANEFIFNVSFGVNREGEPDRFFTLAITAISGEPPPSFRARVGSQETTIVEHDFGKDRTWKYYLVHKSWVQGLDGDGLTLDIDFLYP